MHCYLSVQRVRDFNPTGLMEPHWGIQLWECFRLEMALASHSRSGDDKSGFLLKCEGGSRTSRESPAQYTYPFQPAPSDVMEYMDLHILKPECGIGIHRHRDNQECSSWSAAPA
jgi:hypothetical protein